MGHLYSVRSRFGIVLSFHHHSLWHLISSVTECLMRFLDEQVFQSTKSLTSNCIILQKLLPKLSLLNFSALLLVSFSVEVLVFVFAGGPLVRAWWCTSDWLEIVVFKVDFVFEDFRLAELSGVELVEGCCVCSHQDE